MYVIVGGAGEVGYHVARSLREEGHDVAVIENDPERLVRVQELDVLTVEGNLASRAVLEQARIADAQLFIACSRDDEVNMVAAVLAKAYGARTIARINDNEYLNVPYSTEYAKVGIDVAVCPEMVAAIRVKRLLNQATLMNTDVFAQGKVIVAEGRVAEDAFVVGKQVGDVEPPAGLNLFAIYRGDDVIIPRPRTRFQVNDRLLLALASPEILQEVVPYIGKAKEVKAGPEVKRVMIAGATRVGVHLARLLEQSRRDVVLVERDEALCEWASERLQKTLVVHGNVTDRRMLIQENVDTFDAFVGATKVEEYNVLAALMAKQLGVGLTVALIHQPELKEFLERLDIDLAVAPRLATVGAILKQVHAGAEEMALQNLGEEQLLVFRVGESSEVAGQKLKRIGFPDDSLVAAVVRGDRVLLPRGEDTLEAGDTVVVFCLNHVVGEVERLFA